MADDKLLNIECMPQIKLGFTQLGSDDVNHINKYIDDNADKLIDLSSSLVGQIKQSEKSKQLEFDLNDSLVGFGYKLEFIYGLKLEIRNGSSELLSKDSSDLDSNQIRAKFTSGSPVIPFINLSCIMLIFNCRQEV